MNLKKIICPVDMADPVSATSDYARLLAKATGAVVIALAVVKMRAEYEERQMPLDDDSLVDAVIARTKANLADYIARHLSGVQTIPLVLEGDPAERILHIADREQADMIIMGTHGRRGIGRLLFGSVATEVTQKAQCPVLTIRPHN